MGVRRWTHMMARAARAAQQCGGVRQSGRGASALLRHGSSRHARHFSGRNSARPLCYRTHLTFPPLAPFVHPRDTSHRLPLRKQRTSPTHPNVSVIIPCLTPQLSPSSIRSSIHHSSPNLPTKLFTAPRIIPALHFAKICSFRYFVLRTAKRRINTWSSSSRLSPFPSILHHIVLLNHPLPHHPPCSTPSLLYAA